MKCPSCQAEMKAFALHPELECDVCQTCQVYWFDQGELGRALGKPCDYPELALSYSKHRKKKLRCTRCNHLGFLQIPFLPSASPHTFLCGGCEGSLVSFRDFSQIRSLTRNGKLEFHPALLREIRENGPNVKVRSQRKADSQTTIRIVGTTVPFVEVDLLPGERIWGEAGAMVMMGDGVEMFSFFSDPTNPELKLVESVVSAGKRLLGGEGLFLTEFENKSSRKRKVLFSSPVMGEMNLIDLSQHNREILCQRGAFVCGSRGTEIGLMFQKNLMTGAFSGEGFILQKLQGKGIVAIHACGALIKKTLGRSEKIRIQTGSLVALERSVKMKVELLKGVRQMLFSGEGLFITTLEGPGHVWLQTRAQPTPSSGQGSGHEQATLGMLLSTLSELTDQ